MFNKSKIRLTPVSFAHAEKRVMGFYSDNFKEITPMMTYRLRLDTSVIGGAIGATTFLVPGNDVLSGVLRGVVLLAGIATLEVVDANQAKKMHDRKNLLRACEDLITHVGKQEPNKVFLPNNLETALEQYIERKGYPKYDRAKDPVKKYIRTGAIAGTFLAAAYITSHIDITKVRDLFNEVGEQPVLALPPEKPRQKKNDPRLGYKV